MKHLKVPILIFLCMVLLSGASLATTYTISDMYNEFPGINTPKAGQDHNGVPYIFSAQITIDAGYIKEIMILGDHFNHGALNPGYWDSLFINVNDGSSIGNIADGAGGQSWDNWDYYINTDFGETVYSVPDSGWSYTLANSGGYRNGHPNGISGYGDDSLLFVDWSKTDDWVKYDFVDETNALSMGIPVIDGVIFGYTPYCANEVFLGSVPEPSNMFLLGAGLIGLVTIGRKRFIK